MNVNCYYYSKWTVIVMHHIYTLNDVLGRSIYHWDCPYQVEKKRQSIVIMQMFYE